MNGSHGDHRRVLGRGLAADDGLQREHELRRHDHGVLCGFGTCAVPADTANGHIHRARAGQHRSRDHAHLAGGNIRRVVLRDAIVRPAKTLVEPVG